MENEGDAVLAQLRRVLALLETGALSKEQALEFESAEAMLRSLVSHGEGLTDDQATELVSLFGRLQELSERLGIEEAPIDVLHAAAEKLKTVPEPTEN